MTSGNLTDFGGGVKKRDKNSIEGGLREFVEESLGVFGSFSENDVKDCLVVYSEMMMIMFLHLNFDKSKTISLFQERFKQIRQPEIRDLIFLNKDQLFNLINCDDDPFSKGNNFFLSCPSVRSIGHSLPIDDEDNIKSSELYTRVQMLLDSAIISYGDFTSQL